MADAGAVAGLRGEHFADLLSRAWTNRGWETEVIPDDDGTFMVAGDQGSQRGLILVFPGDADVPGQRLQQFASLVSKKSVDVPVVATQGGFTDDAERIANANDVHLLRPPDVAETIEAEGLGDQFETYADDADAGDEAGGGLAAKLPIPLPGLGGLPIPGGVPASLPRPSLGGRATKTVLVLLLLVASVVAGFAGGAFLVPGANATGGTGGVAVAGLSTATTDAGLTVRWNARTTDTVTANGSTYPAPSGQQFVVVQYAITNTGSERVPVRADDFLLNANGTRYSHQPLEGARTFELTGVAPGNRTTGWLAYAIPANATDAVLVPNPDAAGGPVNYIHDPTLTVNGTA